MSDLDVHQPATAGDDPPPPLTVSGPAGHVAVELATGRHTIGELADVLGIPGAPWSSSMANRSIGGSDSIGRVSPTAAGSPADRVAPPAVRRAAARSCPTTTRRVDGSSSPSRPDLMPVELWSCRPGAI